jgi:predicted dehydrogenase
VFGSFMNNTAKKVKRFDVLTPFTRRSGLQWEKDVLAKDACDATYVCSPDVMHATHAKECMENGKHVLVEKPVYGFESVRDVAQRSGKVLMMIGFHRRHDIQFKKAKEYIQKQMPKNILIESYDPVPEDIDLQNVVCNSVVHDLDVIHWLFDHEAKVRFEAERSGGKTENSSLDLRFNIETSKGHKVDARILYRKCFPKYIQRLAIDQKVFGYEFEAPLGIKFPADWSVSGPCMANEWEAAYKEQYEEFVNMIESGDTKKWIQLLDEYSTTFNMMESVAQHFKNKG